MVHVPLGHTANQRERAHQHDPPNSLGRVAQWRPLLTPTILPEPASQYIDLTAPKTLPRALSQQLTLKNRERTPQLFPSPLGNEQSPRSSKVRLAETSNMFPFVRHKSALTRHQSLISSLRDVRLGRLRLLSTWKVVQLGRIYGSVHVGFLNLGSRLHPPPNVDLWNRAIHPLRASLPLDCVQGRHFPPRSTPPKRE